MKKCFILLLCCFGITQIQSAELSIEPEKNGVLVFKDGDTAVMRIGIAFYSDGWTPCQLDRVNDARKAEKGTESIYEGAIFDKRSNTACSYSVTYSVADQTVKVAYKLTIPETVTMQKGENPFVQIKLAADRFKDKTIKLGNKSITFPVNGKWGSGTDIVLPPIEHTIKVSPSGGFSAWKERHGFYELRSKLKADSETEFSGELTIEPKAAKVTQTIDTLTEKMTAYNRVLSYPLMAGLDSSYGWQKLELAAKEYSEKNSKATTEHLSALEDWFGFRTEVYNAGELFHQLEIFDQIEGSKYGDGLRAEYQAVVSALSKGDIENGSALVKKLEAKLQEVNTDCRKKYGSYFTPMRQQNRLGWLKAFSLNGFARHREGTYTQEPLPWRVEYQDGVRFSLVPDPAGVGPLEAKRSGVRFLTKQDKRYHFQRSWVTNKWISDKATISFSVLSPLILVDNTEQLSLKGLPSPIKNIFLPEDESLRKITIADENTFQTAKMSGNWFLLDGGYYYLGIICGEEPQSVNSSQNDLSIKFNNKSFTRVICLPYSIQVPELIREMDFWSKVAMKVPVETIETISNGKATYRYLYNEKKDVWGTPALTIAPLPHLAILADVKTDKIKKSSYVTKYGNYLYAVGDAVTYPVPKSQKLLQGINVKVTASQKELDAYKQMGMEWVRLFIRNKIEPEKTFSMVVSFLERCRKSGLKVLVDPHDFMYNTGKWADDFPRNPEKENTFVELWDRLSKIGSKFPDTVVGYDLYNEIKVRNQGWPYWRQLAQKLTKVIRSNDPDTTIYMTGLDMANVSGYRSTEAKPISEKNTRYSFHMYAPHAFTHQKVHTTDIAEPFVFFPGWIGTMDWVAKKHYGGAPLTWWDRWEVGASMLPVLEFSVKNNVAMHCGEFGAIGYAKPKSVMSAVYWTNATMQWCERFDINWHLWNMGYGLVIPQVKDSLIQHLSEK